MDEDTSEKIIRENVERACSSWHDGRILPLSSEIVDDFKRMKQGEIKKSRFNSERSAKPNRTVESHIYFCKEDVSGWKCPLVLKEIIIKSKDMDDLRTVKYHIDNEQSAARLRHVAIVPLLATTNSYHSEFSRSYSFIMPFMQHGDLREMLDEDNKHLESLKLGSRDRLRVLFQIASALAFLHKPVTPYRGIILHLDIKTPNIALDDNANARLLDFGLAREVQSTLKTHHAKFDRSLLGAEGYIPPDNKIGDEVSTFLDCYAFGVVVREVLTGLTPVVDDLRNKTETEIAQNIMKLWKRQSTDDDSILLIGISEKCLLGKMEMSNVENDLADHTRSKAEDREFRVKNQTHDKCELCVLNPSVSEAPKDHESCNISVCLECLQSSRLNPIKCRICDKAVHPAVGGTGTCGILISGGDGGTFNDDVTSFRKILLSSRMGINKSNVVVVKPKEGEITMKRQIETKLQSLKEHSMGITSLILYFFGHGNENGELVLDNFEERLPITTLINMVIEIPNLGKLIVFLDCCYPRKVLVSSDSLVILQINACKSNEKAMLPKGECETNSPFTKFLLQGIDTCPSEDCLNVRLKYVPDCGICKDYRLKFDKINDYIAFDNLFTYIHEHMKTYGNCRDRKVNLYQQRAGTDCDKNIAFSPVEDKTIRLPLLVPGEENRIVCIDRNSFRDITEWKQIIFVEFLLSREIRGLDSSYSDVLCFASTGELKTMEDVKKAWEEKRFVQVRLREIAEIRSGRVGVFMDESCSRRRHLEELQATIRLEIKREETKGDVVTVESWYLNELVDGLNKKLPEDLLTDKLDQLRDHL